MTNKENALPRSAFVDCGEEKVAFQRLLELTPVPCRGHEELFFADPEDETELEDPEVAVDMCLDCPVMFQCRQFARQSGIEFGVYGGETAAKRNKYLRSQKRKGKK